MLILRFSKDLNGQDVSEFQVKVCTPEEGQTVPFPIEVNRNATIINQV
jgi:hypothetical protein